MMNRPAPTVQRPALFAPIVLVLAASALSTSALAQTMRSASKPTILSDKPDRTVIALEYLPAANGTQKAGGIGLYRVSEDGPGLYMQFLTDLNTERPRVGGDPARFPEPTAQRFNEVTAITVGATSRASGQLTLFGGLGLVSTTPVTEKNDSLRRLSSSGRYFVEDGARRENRLGVQVGVQFNLQNVVLGASYNSEIGNPQFSLGYRF